MSSIICGLLRFTHALAAQDFERAADLIEREWSANSGTYFQNAIWTGWVQRLPDTLIRTRLTLSLGFAWALLFSGELQAAADRLRDANRLLGLAVKANGSFDSPSNSASSNSTDVANDEQHHSLRSLLAIAWAFHAQAIGDNAGTIKHAHQALSLLSSSGKVALPQVGSDHILKGQDGTELFRRTISEEDHYIIGLASSLLGLAYWANEDLDAAIRYMSDATARLRMTGHFLYAISGAYVLASIKIVQGRLFDAINIYKETLQFATTLGEPALPGTADLHLGLSKLYREQGKVDAAREHLLKCEALGKQAALPEWPYALKLAQACFKEDQGKLDDALKLIEEAEQFYRRGPVPNVRPVAALKTQVWLRQGRLAEALHWIRSRGLSIEDGLTYLHEFEHITLARALITRYEIDQAEQAIHQAVGLLARLLKAAEEGQRNGSVLEILVLQALAHKIQGNTPIALKPLERALTLAEPEGYVRVFVDEGMPVAELLRAAVRQGIMPDYTGKLLAAFGAEKQPCLEQQRSDQQWLEQPVPTHTQSPLLAPS